MFLPSTDRNELFLRPQTPRLIEIGLGGKLCRCKQLQSLKSENARSVDNSRFIVCRVPKGQDASKREERC